MQRRSEIPQPVSPTRGRGGGVGGLPGSPSHARGGSSPGSPARTRGSPSRGRGTTQSTGASRGRGASHSVSPSRGRIPAASGGTGAVATGMRYITDDLIRKLGKENDLNMITSLNLTLTKGQGKKIKYIENLEGLRRLENLSLSCNVIEKIEKLDKLTRLQELDLSYNAISRIEGIDMLTLLRVLNLTGNKIEVIPAWVPKKLRSLQVFKIAKNKIQSLSEITRLRPLKDLTQLAAAQNPVAQLPHYRHYLVFHLHTLSTLDNQPISIQERQTAQSRFQQEELDSLQQMVAEKEAEIERLKESHDRSLSELQERNAFTATQKAELRQHTELVQQLELELSTKNDLLKKKTSELTKACEKHYELEQELAFYKIDHKFESLGKVPSPDSESGADDGEGLIGESPYLGKGRFQKLQRVRQHVARQGSAETVSSMDSEARERMHQILDLELDEKRNAIEKAQERLMHLQDDLQATEGQLSKATRELESLKRVPGSRPLTEDDKQEMHGKLAKKINKVQNLRNETQKLEVEMKRAQKDIQEQERGIGQLQGKLRRVASKDSLYDAMTREVRDQEGALAFSHQMYNKMQEQLQKMLATIAREAADIKKLEQELRDGQVAQNEEIKSELEGIIQGLQGYLSDVQERAQTEHEEYKALLREREDLVHHMEDIEMENQQLAVKEEEIQYLQKQLEDLEATVEEQRENNKSLRHQLDETRMQEAEDVTASQRLHDAEDELAKLKQRLRDAEVRAQAEAENHKRQLEEERQKAEAVAQRERNARNLQGDLDELHNQLMELQNANTNLQDQLYSEKQKHKEQKRGAVDPDDLKQRLQHVVRSLRSGKPWEREAPPAGDDNDHIGRVLSDLQNQVQRELDRSFHELEKARDAQAKAERQAASLREVYEEAVEQERERAERTAQAQLESEQQEMENLKYELDQLRAELERERKTVKRHALPHHLLEPSTQSDQVSATTPRSSSEEETSSIPSSQWSSRRRNLYDSMTHDEQDLFDELQKEIEELRKLLGMRDKDAAQKARDAERKASKLRQMINGRRKRESERDSEQSHHPSHRSHPHSSQTARDAANRLREAADDLMSAQEEIDSLHNKLREKDKQLQHKPRETERNELTIAAQQDEIDQLTGILEEQRSEIMRLADQLDSLKRQDPEHSLSYEEDVQQLRRGAADLRNNIAAQGPHVQRLSRSDYHPPEGHRTLNRGPRDRDERSARDEPDIYRTESRGRDRHRDRSRGRQAERTPERSHRSDYRGQHRSPDRGDFYEERSRHPADVYDGYRPGSYPQDYPEPRYPPHEPRYPSPDQYYRDGYPHPPRKPHSEPPHQYPGGAVSQPQGGPQYGPYPGPHVTPAPVYGPSPAHMAPPAPPVAQPHIQGPMIPGIPQGGVPISAAHPVMPPASMPAGGAPVYALANEPVTLMAPVTPPSVRMVPAPNSGSQSFLVSAQTTPIAGNGYNAPLQQIGGATVQPIMVSTPVASPSRGHIKGILKNQTVAAASDEELVCTVPQHHDLEDYVAKLQTKVKSLKNKLKQQANKSLEEEESRHVLFEEDVDRDTIRRLKTELEDRRAELEGLDLAIERQKASLKHMKASERVLLAEKTAVKEELERIRNDPVARADRRHKFLRGDLDIEITDDDYDYEFPARSHMSRREYLSAELDCLEETLAKRRAELREADALLVECEEDLHDAQQQAIKMLNNYESGKYGSKQAANEALDLEQRAELAGRNLIETSEEMQRMKEEMLELKDLRESQEQMLADIQKVIAVKDLEFQELDAKVRLKAESLSSQDYVDHGQTHLKLSSDYPPELANVHKQVAEGKAELEELDHEIGRNKAELVLLEDTIQKRRTQLDALDSEVDQEISVKRKKLQMFGPVSSRKEVEDHLGSLREKEKQIDSDVKTRSEQLKEVQDSLNHEETVLQNLSEMTQKQRAGLQQLTRQHTDTQNDVTSLTSQLALAKSQLEQVKSKQEEDEREIKRIENEKVQRARDLEHLMQSLDRTKNDFDTIREQYRAVEGSTDSLRREKTSLEETQKMLEKKITSLKRNQTSAEESLRTVQARLTRAEQESQELESELEERKQEKADLTQECRKLRTTLQDSRHELDKLQTDIEAAEDHVNRLQQLHIGKTAELDGLVKELGIKRVELHHVHARHDVLKREAERRQINEDKLSKLEQQVRQLGQDLESRTHEKEHLVSALAKSCDELQESHTMRNHENEAMESKVREFEQTIEKYKMEREDRLKEIGELRDKCSRDIADLEGIAQAHYSRANRLNDELNYLRGEFLVVKRQLASQEELAEREKQLQETLQQLKSEIKAEVSGGIQDLEKSRIDAENELEQLHGQKGDIQHHLGSLKHSLNIIRSGTSVPNTKPTEKMNASDQFALQQDLLKRQLQQKLTLQAEVVEAQRQLSQDRLRQLQAKLASMEQTYSPSDSITPASKVTLSDLEPSSSRMRSAELSSEFHSTQPSQMEETRRKRAYSPHRHSQVRLGRCTSTDSLVPEKGPSE